MPFVHHLWGVVGEDGPGPGVVVEDGPSGSASPGAQVDEAELLVIGERQELGHESARRVGRSFCTWPPPSRAAMAFCVSV